MIRKLGPYMLLLGIFLATGAQLLAQTDPNLEQGLKPYGTFHGGEIDSISMTNGNLNLHIPLLSLPQRGNVHLGYSLFYTNKNYTPRTVCDGTGTCTDTLTWYGNSATQASGVAVGADSGLFFHQTIIKSTQTNPTIYLLSERAPDGSSHPMAGLPAGSTRSVDASGILNSIDQNGIRYSGTCPLAEDPNGNQLCTGDTLGRTVPSSNTTDYTGCTGPLAISSAGTWNVPGPSGTTSNFKFCYVLVPVVLIYNLTDGTQTNGTVSMLQSVILPNGTTWTFAYSNDGNGDLTQITFPSGGTLGYTWGGGHACNSYSSAPGSEWVYSRTLNANDGTGPHTWIYTWNDLGTSASNIVKDPLNNETVYTVTGLGGGCSYYTTVEAFYQGSHTTGTLLKTTSTQYSYSSSPFDKWQGLTFEVINVLPTQVTTTWASGKTSQVQKTYDTGFTFIDPDPRVNTTYTGLYGKVLIEKIYDFGTGAPGPLLRQTNTNYLALSNSNYLANNLLSLPSSVSVYDGGGILRAQTLYGYDESALAPSGVTTNHDANPPTGAYRGNLTSVQRWLNNGTLTCPNGHSAGTNSFVKSTSIFYDTGMAQSSTDPCVNTTSFQYSATYVGAYPTTVTNALNQATTHAYDFNAGLLSSSTDPNNLSTSYTYDSMWRLASVTAPNGGTTTITHQETAFPFTATLNKQINTSQTETSANVFDGLGRLKQTQLTSDPQGIVFTDTAYDALGRVATVSNPYRVGTDITTTTGTTAYGYDALGRKTSETYPDNSVLTTAYCGPSTLVKDPTSRWRRSRVDGLGRLVEVDEPNSPTATVASTGCPGTGEPIWVTSYGYDALGNLLSVLQNGSHQRTFTYDSFSRLLTSANPEVGTITYTYNPDGPLLTKRDARSITTTYLYDALHRETSASYSNGDPTVTTVYDGSNCLGLTACQNIGHRTSMTDGAGSEIWSYQVDATNHRGIRKDQRTTNSSPSNITKTSTYYLDLAGNVTQAVYPTGRVVNYTYDSADRPSTATDGSNGIAYAAGFKTSPGSTCLTNVACYTPQGTFYALSIGQSPSLTNGLNLTHIYNSRLQPLEFKASSAGGNAIDIIYSFVDPSTSKNAGHVFSATSNIDPTRSQTFSYDQLNRITSALTTSTHATSPAHCWGETFQYDGVTNGAWGNLTQIAATTNSAYTGCTQESGFTKTADVNNHLSGFTYDSSGNTQNDGVNSYTWDGESQLKSGAGVNYLYDGDGRRVSKVGSKLYWYGSGGEILAETNAGGNTTAEYIFFGGKRIAMLPASGTPIYYVEDLLGTSRVITTNTGAVCYDADFYPFGGERTPYTNTCPQNNYKFEGKERDTETGNDDFGARYYSNRFGRWLSADWSSIPVAIPYANLTNPQTLNLYSMVADDPESFADLDGHGPQGGANPSQNTSCDNNAKSTCGDPGREGDPTAAQAQNQSVCGSNANCVGVGQKIDVKDTGAGSASGNAAFLKAEQVGLGGKISGGVVDATINTTSLAPGQLPGNGVSTTGQVSVQGGVANAEASAKVSTSGAQLTAGAEALLFKFGGTLNLHLGPVTLQVSANYQFGLAAKASGSATIGPHGLPTSVGGRVSAALGPLGASGGITLGSTKAMTSQQ